MNRTIRRVVPILGLAVALRAPLARAQADAGLPAEMRSAIDAAAREVLAATGAPSASVAVLRDGKIAYVQAYGDAKVDPRAPAMLPKQPSPKRCCSTEPMS